MTDVAFALELAAEATPTQPTQVAFALNLDLEVRPDTIGRRWRVVAVRFIPDTETVEAVAWLENAVLGSASFVPCEAEEFSFTLQASDSKAHLFQANPNGDDKPYQEVQVWFGDRCIAWGPAVDPHWGADGTVAVRCRGAAWYPTERRNVGPARRENNLRNGIFAGPSGPSLQNWEQIIANGEDAFIGPDVSTFISAVAHPTINAFVARFTDNTAEAPDADRQPLLAQELRFNASGTPFTVTLRARVFVERFDAPNQKRAALELFELPIGYDNVWKDAIQVRTGTTLDKEHPLNELVDHECSITIPWSGNDRIVRAHLLGCKGVIDIADVWMEHDDRLGFNDTQSNIFVIMCDHLTGNPGAPYLYSKVHPDFPWFQEPYNKSWVHIHCDAPLSRIMRQRSYLFSQRPSGSSVLGEFASLDDGLEWSIRYTGQRREIFTQHPKLGRARADCRLSSVHGRGNVPTWDYQFLGEQGATSVTVQPVSGGWREGAAIDVDAFGGLTLEDSVSAPPESNRDLLDPVAKRRLASTRYPARVDLSAPFDYWANRGLREGDRVPVLLKRGDLTVDGTWWIRKLEVTPGQPHVKLSLIPWTLHEDPIGGFIPA